MRIIGAGMTGLLAGAMLRNECDEILESQEDLPNNHSAVLRFRSSVVSDVLNIPFRKVNVLRANHPWQNAVADALAYSLKTNGTATLRSITMEPGYVERYIAPEDFIAQAAALVKDKIKYQAEWLGPAKKLSVPVISTIPMPILAQMLNYDTAENEMDFQSVKGYNIVCKLDNVNAYCSLYIPQPSWPGARITITGNGMVIECLDPSGKNGPFITSHSAEIVDEALTLMGLSNCTIIERAKVINQAYAKILPVSEIERKRFILWATENYNIYSLGRFATWRPGLLLDDVVNDVRVIHGLVSRNRSSYDHQK